MLQLAFQLSFLIISTSITVATALSTNSFSWRGNVLWLKDTITATGTSAPFKLDTSGAITDVKEDLIAATSSGQYPLLPDSKWMFPGQVQEVFCNEMKFRELMYDCNTFFSTELIRCYVDETGGIERTGVLCRIIEFNILEDGQALYTIEGMRKILIEEMTVKPGKSYLTSSKSSTDIPVEEFTDDAILLNEMLAIDTFKFMKKILRLSRLKFTALNDTERADGVHLTAGVLEHRPAQDDYSSLTPSQKTERHYHFSNAIVSLFILPDVDPYYLLTASTDRRLALLCDRIIEGTWEFLIELREMSRANSNEELAKQVEEVEANVDDGTLIDLVPIPRKVWTFYGDACKDLFQ